MINIARIKSCALDRKESVAGGRLASDSDSATLVKLTGAPLLPVLPSRGI
jgi:hypothetical protein